MRRKAACTNACAFGLIEFDWFILLWEIGDCLGIICNMLVVGCWLLDVNCRCLFLGSLQTKRYVGIM